MLCLLMNPLFAHIVLRLFNASISADNEIPQRILVDYPIRDKPLRFISSLLKSVYEHDSFLGCITYSAHIVDAPDIFPEAPLQIITASCSASWSCAIVLGTTNYQLLAYSESLKPDTFEWKYPITTNLGRQAVLVVDNLSDLGLLVNPTFREKHAITGVAAITRNPGHQLFNEISPSLYLYAMDNTTLISRGKWDYFGLKRLDFVNAVPSFMLNRMGINIEIYLDSIRIFGYNKSMARIPALELVFKGKSFCLISSCVTGFNNVQGLTPNRPTIYLSLRSDKKRKLLADPFQEFGDAVERVISCLKKNKRIHSGFNLQILIDGFAIPCKNCSFPYSQVSYRRENRFSELMCFYLRQRFSHHVNVLNLTGMSFLEKMQINMMYRPIFIGYAGASFAVYSWWSGLDTPSLLYAHNGLFDIYGSPHCQEIIGKSLVNNISAPSYTSHNCIWEATNDPWPFDFFECDKNPMREVLDVFAEDSVLWIEERSACCK